MTSLIAVEAKVRCKMVATWLLDPVAVTAGWYEVWETAISMGWRLCKERSMWVIGELPGPCGTIDDIELLKPHHMFRPRWKDYYKHLGSNNCSS